MKLYDLIVIGTGTAGQVVASHCREAGWTVAIIDSRPFGGTCQLRGCDPKKVLVAAAESLYSGRRLQGSGVFLGTAQIDWHDLITFKHTFTDHVPDKHEQWFRENDIDQYHGRAKFIGSTLL